MVGEGVVTGFREKGFRGSDDGGLVGLERVDEGVRGGEKGRG